MTKLTNCYLELVEFWDAGSTFYSADFWSLWDLGIIATGVAFLVVRAIGLWKHDDKLIDTAFDIVSVEALFLVPRICSLLSLHPYFGTLLPCLREMVSTEAPGATTLTSDMVKLTA